ncbi:MAG TPA: hypothetical protein DIW47_00270 [Bacteroidetes bacterium]|nr:hypothetical protein [Bacteroidota bacterium]
MREEVCIYFVTMQNLGGNAAINEVMLIDDEPIDLFINERLLKAYSFAKRYIAFEDALLALKELRNRAGSGAVLPDIIFLDYFMPLIDGFDFVSRIKELELEFPDSFSGTRIIMLTTLKSPEKRKKLEEFERIFAIMSKPLNEAAVKDLSGRLFQHGQNQS